MTCAVGVLAWACADSTDDVPACARVCGSYSTTWTPHTAFSSWPPSETSSRCANKGGHRQGVALPRLTADTMHVCAWMLGVGGVAYARAAKPSTSLPRASTSCAVERNQRFCSSTSQRRCGCVATAGRVHAHAAGVTAAGVVCRIAHALAVTLALCPTLCPACRPTCTC